MEIINKKTEELIPYVNNPRQNDAAVDAVASSIKEFGFKVPCVITADNVVVTGHTRLKAAHKLGLDSVPCIVADDLTDAQIKAFRLADNKVSELAAWDEEALAAELQQLEDMDVPMADFGFDSALLHEADTLQDDNYCEPIPEEPKAKLGQVYKLGEHRLMCGDSTSAEDVAKLMGGA